MLGTSGRHIRYWIYLSINNLKMYVDFTVGKEYLKNYLSINTGNDMVFGVHISIFRVKNI